ncbi:PREDICTED: F-box only protein 21 [Thamnophis sirtalis]|uniref:F-box only protein 21 n=1 Tax=Thamnophis sirtalis TaxID=35019 RepID=A0A6I9Z5R5_9SAUR|nr:PREDICTED: F-box only protein 21 [Thamnophis sirtalis]
MAAAEREACEEAAEEAEEQRAGPASAPAPLSLTELPGELLELILCCGSLGAADLGRLSCSCRHLRDACQPRGKVWREQLRRSLSFPSMRLSISLLMYDETTEVKKRFTAKVPCDGFTDIETLDCPSHFFEDELMSILNTGGRKGLTWKYYAKKILYFLRQQNILKKLKTYLEYSADEQSFLEGAVLVDQYCNPLSDISLKCIQVQIDDIAAKVCKFLKSKNPRHPTVDRKAGMAFSTVLLAQLFLRYGYNCVIYGWDPVCMMGHEWIRNMNVHSLPHGPQQPFYNVLVEDGSCRYAAQVAKCPNFDHVTMGCYNSHKSTNIFDYTYIDAFGKGQQLTVKECEYLIGHHVTEEFYGVATAKEVLQRMVGNLLNIGKRESTDQSYQLLRDSLDLYLAMYPDNVQHLMLQARLYFHLGIWPEKVLDILQHIQALDPSQQGAVGYLVQHTLEHIERRKDEAGPDVKLHSDEKHKDITFSIGLVMKHKR